MLVATRGAWLGLDLKTSKLEQKRVNDRGRFQWGNNQKLGGTWCYEPRRQGLTTCPTELSQRRRWFYWFILDFCVITQSIQVPEVFHGSKIDVGFWGFHGFFVSCHVKAEPLSVSVWRDTHAFPSFVETCNRDFTTEEKSWFFSRRSIFRISVVLDV